jgi:hypothetical protein
VCSETLDDAAWRSVNGLDAGVGVQKVGHRASRFSYSPCGGRTSGSPCHLPITFSK